MGGVYRVSDLLTGQDVALKRAATSTAQLRHLSHSDLTSFEVALVQEFSILASLRHPNIVSVLDFGFDEHRHPYFTMSLLENSMTILEARQGRSWDRQVDLILQLLQALAHLHRRSILHRDLKPGNVMVVDGQVKVLDFGLSMISTLSTADATRSTVGTLAYMAPEVIQGESPSRGTDLYAVGMITYELISGRYPYDLSNIGVLLNQTLNVPIDDIASLGLNTDLEAMLGLLLAKSRQERYDDASGVIRDLSDATNRPNPTSGPRWKRQSLSQLGNSSCSIQQSSFQRCCFLRQPSVDYSEQEASLMLEKLLPKTVDNHYRDLSIAKWIFVAMTALTIARSLAHVFLQDGGAQSIATIPLDAFSSDASAVIVGMFAQWGLTRLMFGLLYVLVLWRYQSLIPLMWLFIAFEWSGRLLLGFVKPFETVGTAPGANWQLGICSVGSAHASAGVEGSLARVLTTQWSLPRPSGEDSQMAREGV